MDQIRDRFNNLDSPQNPRRIELDSTVLEDLQEVAGFVTSIVSLIGATGLVSGLFVLISPFVITKFISKQIIRVLLKITSSNNQRT